MGSLLKKPNVQYLIERAVAQIVRRFRPEKVILFGSHVRGNVTPESDIDLLVIMDYEGSKLDKMVELRGALSGVTIPIDILLTTPEDFAWRKEIVGTLEWPAFREGKVMYARYAVITRYPQAGLTISLREARSAVAAARRIRTEARRVLPRAALRKSN